MTTSPARSRFLRLTAILFVVMAVVSWWILIEDGPSPARLIAAIAATVGAAVQIVVRVKGPGDRRGRG